MRRFTFFFAGLLMTLSALASSERVTSVWSGEYSFPENDGYIGIGSDKFVDLKLGDFLRVVVSATEKDKHSPINIAGTNPWTEVPGTSWAEVKEGTYLYQINDADLFASITLGGIGVQGAYFTLTDISIVDASNLKSIWSGEYNFPEAGDGSQDISFENFKYLKLGDYILVTVSAITNPDGWTQINMAGKDPWTTIPETNWSDIKVGKSLYQINDAALLASIKKGGLQVQGKYFTMTDISIPNGSWDAWLGTQTFDAGWSNNVQIDKESFAEMEVGYRLALSINTMTAGQCVNVQAGDWTDFPHKELYVFTEEDVTAESKVIEFELSPVDVEIIKEKGLIVKGTSFTLTDVKVVPNVPSLTNMKHDLSITDAGMATIMLPYYVPALPEDMKAYTLMMQGDYIAASEVTTIMPDEAVLIVAPQGEYTLISVEGVSDALSSKENTYTYGALVGTYKKSTVPTSANPTYNYVLQNGNEGVGFYQVQSDDIAINPYRAYLTCGYNNNNQQNAPLRLVFPKNAATSIENVTPTISAGKLIRNGRIYIQRDNKIYTIHGLKIQ